MLIGELVGDVSTDAFTFEAYKEIRKFDFVAVKNPKDGKEWILAQVDSVKKSPEGKTEAEANIIGFREKGMLKQPRHVIKPDSMVYRADEDVIAETLGLTQDGLYMGRLETNPDIRIFVNPSDLYKHIAVLAQTGAGKSYATGVMLEELLEQNYPIIVIDPHGEYHSIEKPNEELSAEDKEKYGVEAKGYPVTEYSTNLKVNPDAERLAFSSKNLDAKELGQLIPTNLTNSQLEVLYNALKELKKRDSYTLQDIIDKAMNQDSKAKWNLVNVLEIVQDSNLFADRPTNLEGLVNRGEVSIVNLRGVDPENQEMVVYKLAKELFEKRKIGKMDPFIMVMEEAHNFVPERNFGKAVCSDILRTIASEGRKFGMGIGVISQRPARVDKNILSQCNTQLILRVTNPNDLNAISRSFEGVTNEVQKSITSLSPGVGLVLGKEYPVMTNIRTRRSKHGGVTQELQHGEPGDTAADDAPAAETTTTETEPGQEPAQTEPSATDAAVREPQAVAEGETEQETEAEAETAAPQAAADTVEEGVANAEDHMPSAQVRKQQEERQEQVENEAESAVSEPEPVEAANETPAGAAAEGSTAATANDADNSDSGSGITAIVPALDVEKLRDEVGSLKTAYYPLWIVSADDEKVAVDATDGAVKGRKKPLNDVEAAVMDLIKKEDRTRGNLLEVLDVSLTKLEQTLQSLEEKGLIVEEEGVYTFNGVDLFDQDTEPVTGDDHSEISTDVSEGEAIRIAKQELSTAPDGVEKLYYPYYTAGKRVFDGVLGEEI